jgi:EmrB/QacA subfamily drug resistance transporter
MATATTQGAGGATAESPVGLSHKQILAILSGLLMGMFLAALDQTIVSTAIRTIADDLHGLSVQAWVTTAYLITSTIATPLYGKLSDIYGRKKFFIAAISIFIAGSMLCTLANSMYELAGFRAFQGIGAGGLFTLALSIIGDIVSPRERARYQGYFLAVFGTSSVLGPVIGGFLAGQATILGVSGWRWVFLVNVPIGIAALFVVSATLKLPHFRREHRIDWWGATFLTVSLVPLLTVAEQGRTWGWASGWSLTCFVVGILGLVGFIYAEWRMGEDALIPLRLFKNRTISLSLISSVVTGAGLFGAVTVLPLYLQIVHGASPTEAGFLMLPFVIGLMSAAIVSGQIISKTGRYRTFPIMGAILMCIGLLLLWRVRYDTPLPIVMLFMLITGYGLGNTMQPLMLAVQNSVSPRDIGVATSSSTFFRQIGGTLGVAVFLSILFSTVGDKIAAALKTAAGTPDFQAAAQNPSIAGVKPNSDFLAALQAQAAGKTSSFFSGVLNDSSVINKLAKPFAQPFKIGFSESMDSVFLVGACVVVVAVVVLAFLPQIELRGTSGLAAQQQDAIDSQAAAAAVSAAAAAPATPARLAPDEGLGRVLEDGGEVGQEA